MDEIFACCAGLDVHKESVEACVRRMEPTGRLHQQTRPWPTMTRDLLAMADWMAAQGVTHVAMESTGVFWKPIYNILEGRFTVLLVNARHLKPVPGRKRDIRDCQWIAQLLQHGLLKGSFIPPRAQRELRDLTRHRVQRVEEKGRTVNRLHKVLEDANLKLASVATDILGVSGRAMLQALIEGQENPVPLADLAQRQLRGKIPELQKALQGYLTEHHRFLLRLLWKQLAQQEAPDRGVGRPNRGAHAPLRRGDRALGRRTGRRSARGRGCAGGSGSRHETVSDSSALGRVGRDVSGQRGECGQTPSAAHHPGQSLAETNARTGRLGSQPHQECLLGLPVPSPRRSARQETRSHRRGTFHPGNWLSSLEVKNLLHRLGW